MPGRGVGLRQVDLAQHRRRPRPADVGDGRDRRRAGRSAPVPTAAWCSRPTPSTRGGPWPRTSRSGSSACTCREGRAARAGAGAARHRRARQVRRPHARAAVGRHAPAGRHRARARARARRAAARRAVRRARRADRGARCRTSCSRVWRRTQLDDPVRDPRHPRGDLPRLARRRARARTRDGSSPTSTCRSAPARASTSRATRASSTCATRSRTCSARCDRVVGVALPAEAWSLHGPDDATSLA